MSNLMRNELKKIGHQLFDYLWKSGLYDRDEAYLWLRKRMNKKKMNNHFAKMNTDEVLFAIQQIARLLRRMQRSRRVQTRIGKIK